MKRFQLVFVALVAMFAFGALSVESASAVEVPVFLLALWLANGNAVNAALSVEAEGELTLEDTKGGPFLEDAAVLCSGLLDGAVLPESLDVISEVLTLGGGSVSTAPLVAPSLTCSNLLNCLGTVEVWAVHLPWDTEVELFEEPAGTPQGFALLILPGPSGGLPGWEVVCTGFSDECTATEGVALLSLEGTTLLGGFEEAFRELAGGPAATCTRGGIGTGLVVSDLPEGAIKFETGTETLSASSALEPLVEA